MDDPSVFDKLRPRLQGIAYRMLSSVAEAEDVVQDARLRWHSTARETIENAEAWLVAVTTRISIDRLRAAKIQREHYTGIWLLSRTSPTIPQRRSRRGSALTTYR